MTFFRYFQGVFFANNFLDERFSDAENLGHGQLRPCLTGRFRGIRTLQPIPSEL